MAQKPRKTSGRIVDITPQADEDRLLAYLNTEQRWGTAQAERYDSLLRKVMQNLSVNPAVAPFVPGLCGVRSTVAKWRRARNGHKIFFEETENGISVLRILHTSMNWREHFGQDE